MVMKCANPRCAKPFGYQFVGRVFRLRLRPGSAGGAPVDVVQYFWLCASCSSSFTLVFDERRGVSLVRFNDASGYETTSMLIFAITGAQAGNRTVDPIDNAHESDLGLNLSNAQEAHRGRKRTLTRKTRSRR
jgi:hypothetical protein